MQRNDETIFQSFYGEKLSAVVFVLDYIQLQFDGPSITAVTLPRVRAGGIDVGFGDATYRDRLCEQIGKIVAECEVKPEEELIIRFEDDSVISISLRPGSYRSPEAAIVRDAKGVRTTVL